MVRSAKVNEHILLKSHSNSLFKIFETITISKCILYYIEKNLIIQIQGEIGGYVKRLEEDRKQYKRTERSLLCRKRDPDRTLRELLVDFRQLKERLQATRKAIASHYDEAVKVRETTRYKQ